jgi:hypothetical protein
MKSLILIAASLLFIGCSSETIVYPDSTRYGPTNLSSNNYQENIYQSRLNGISEDGYFYFDNGLTCRPYATKSGLEGYNYQMKDITIEYLSNIIFVGSLYNIMRVNNNECKIYTSRYDTLSEWLIQDGYGVSRYGDYSVAVYEAKLYQYGLWRYYYNDMENLQYVR